MKKCSLIKHEQHNRICDSKRTLLLNRWGLLHLSPVRLTNQTMLKLKSHSFSNQLATCCLFMLKELSMVSDNETHAYYTHHTLICQGFFNIFFCLFYPQNTLLLCTKKRHPFECRFFYSSSPPAMFSGVGFLP